MRRNTGRPPVVPVGDRASLSLRCLLILRGWCWRRLRGMG